MIGGLLAGIVGAVIGTVAGHAFRLRLAAAFKKVRPPPSSKTPSLSACAW
jgi:uncharacterized membrane protein